MSNAGLATATPAGATRTPRITATSSAARCSIGISAPPATCRSIDESGATPAHRPAGRLVLVGDGLRLAKQPRRQVVGGRRGRRRGRRRGLFERRETPLHPVERPEQVDGRGARGREFSTGGANCRAAL